MSEHKKVKTYIIEDDRFTFSLLGKLLPKWDYEVVGGSVDKDQVQEDIKALKPDLLLVDIHIGHAYTGIDLVKLMNASSQIPVIYLTGDLEEDTINQAKETLPIAYLKKPFIEADLKNILNITAPLFSKIKEKISSLESQASLNEMQISELNETNAHLITATFRERALKTELENSNALIEEQKKKILDSINYALRIQQAIIPSTQDFLNTLGKSFVFYKPKDVVSGDFPWMKQVGDYIYYAAIDCTGHGVPGAMMSMIGNLILNGIIEKADDTPKTPAAILLELHQKVVATLKQDAEENKTADGMDAAFCRLNKVTNELVFAGAHLPLQLLRNGEITTIKGSKFPVGGTQYKNLNIYEDHTIQLQAGDRVFVYSDGIVDQMGGEDLKKWKTKSFNDFMCANQHVPMIDVGIKLEQTFNEYKGNYRQLDDVLVIGVEI
jgi:serine phosphatase RsbU (regulator of sigma subunit)